MSNNIARIGLFIGVDSPGDKIVHLTNLLGQIEHGRMGDKIPDISPQLVGELMAPVSQRGTICARSGQVTLKSGGGTIPWNRDWQITLFVDTDPVCRTATRFTHIICVE
jgi:hypothetical protein